MSKILKKIKDLCKNNYVKLLEKHEVIIEGSPTGTDCNGFSVEELTPAGEELLTQMAWTEYRPKVLELLKKVEASEKKDKKDKNKK